MYLSPKKKYTFFNDDQVMTIFIWKFVLKIVVNKDFPNDFQYYADDDDGDPHHFHLFWMTMQK